MTLAVTTASAESYLCIAEGTVGFDGDNDWKPKIYKSGGKYIVRPPTAKEKANNMSKRSSAPYWVLAFGSDYPEAVCNTISSDGTQIDCGGFIEFKLNTSSLRFVSTRFGGWVHKRLETGDVLMEIGTCTTI